MTKTGSGKCKSEFRCFFNESSSLLLLVWASLFMVLFCLTNPIFLKDRVSSTNLKVIGLIISLVKFQLIDFLLSQKGFRLGKMKLSGMNLQTKASPGSKPK